MPVSKSPVLRIIVTVAILFAGLALGAVDPTPAGAVPGDCVGTVFRDHNANGVLDTRAAGTTVSDANDAITDEPGEPDVTVTAYDDNGVVVGSAVTDATGQFDLDTTVAAGTPIRVEFTWTQPWLESGPNGPDNASSVQFGTAGSCDLDFGVMNPSDYCNDNPFLATTCFDVGPSSGSEAPALAAARYDWGVGEGDFPAGAEIGHTWVDPAGDPAPPIKLAENQDIGTTWGQAWNRDTGNLLLGAFMKANTDFGPDGPGAIYSIPTDPLTGQATGAPTLFADLDALGYSVCADPHGDDLSDSSGLPSLTDATINAVGKCAIGDMDLNYDNSILYVMNLTSREIVRLDATTGADLGSWTFPLDQDTLPAGEGFCVDPATDIRPFALEEHDGKIYAGAVCSGESTALTGDKWSTRGEVWTYVYEVDPATGAFTLVLQYQNLADAQYNQNFSWISTIADIEARAQFSDYGPSADVQYPQPWLTDIEFFNNDLILGFRDRFGDQGGSRIPHNWTGVGERLLSFTGRSSDINCAGWDATTASWVLETNSICGGRVSADANAGEVDEFYADGGSIGHPESSLGGLELIPGHNLVFTVTNPSELLDSNERIVYSAGFGWDDNFDGSPSRGYIFYARDPNDDPSSAGFNPLGKANGLGDVEALCGSAPLEIGNYVWFDADGDGIQDPSEAPVVGATVNLYAADGTTLIATTTTAADGSYYFEVERSTSYVISMDNAADYTTSGPLDGWALTQDSADLDDDADSDGVTGAGGFPEIAYTSGGAGSNDHTLDFGFTQSFDLALTKQLADGTNIADVMVGDTVTFTLTVTNQGGVAATQIALADYVPAGLTLADADWSETGGVATLNTPLPGPLAGGDSDTVDITFTVDAGATGTLNNFAEIASVLDGAGAAVVDVDSTPDSAPSDTGPATAGDADDDNIADSGLAGDDEDDHDVASVTVVATPVFDLALTKQLADGTNAADVLAGDTVTFTLTVVNQGDVAATQIWLVDYIPTGLTLADADWSETGGLAMLNTPLPGPLAGGDSDTVDITFTVDAGAAGTIDNFAEIASALDGDGNAVTDIDSTPDSAPGDTGPATAGDADDDNIADSGLAGDDEDDHDVASVTVVAAPVFDLALTKQLADGTNAADAMVGESVTFTLTVTNQGGTAATQIGLADYVPAGLTLADTDWTETAGVATLNMPLPGPLAPGGTDTVDITFTVDAGATGTLNNFAEIASALDGAGAAVVDVDSTPDSAPGDTGPATAGDADDDNIADSGLAGDDEDDHDVASVTVVDSPVFDLALTKQLADGTNAADVMVGDSVTFTLTVTNQGSVVATQIWLVDYIPTGLTLADSDWSEMGGLAMLNTPLPGPLAGGANTTVDITFTVDADAAGTIDNFAEIASALDGDGNAVTDVDSTPDTSAGDTGPATAGDADDDNIADSGLAGDDEDDHDVASVTVIDTPVFDLALIKQLADGTNLGSVAPGDSVTFTLTVTNQGDIAATQIDLVDYLPDGLSLADADWTEADGVATLVTPVPGPLAPGANTAVDITFTVDADAVGPIDNFAEIASALDGNGDVVADTDSTPDTTPGDAGPSAAGDADDDNVSGNGEGGQDEDDHDVAQLTVDRTEASADVVDLALRKQLVGTNSSGTYSSGDAVTFSIEVFNQGTVSASNITVVDYLPTGLTLNDADWTNLGNGTASIRIAGPLAPNTFVRVDITFSVNANVSGSIVNAAEIFSVTDETGDPVTDTDSVADGTNDDRLIDDVITNDGTDDEDDHDTARVTVAGAPVAEPLAFSGGTAWPLVLLGLVFLLGGLALVLGSERRHV